jgi:aminoglycoside phosphotransferase family enzyme
MRQSKADQDWKRLIGFPAPTLEEKIAFLSDAHSYNASVAAVEVRETHMSWVFLAGDYVLKLKKPVCFPYLNFSTLAKRLMACRTEVDLNRRLARDVYLGAVPLCVSPNGLAIGEGIAAVDWLVKMRRLDEGRMLDNLITKRQVDRDFLDAIVLKLSDFYRHANRVFLRPEVYLKQWKLNLQQNYSTLEDPRFRLSSGLIRYCDAVLRQFLRQRYYLLLNRLQQRRIVDGHGDLRPEHIWLGDDVKIIDCIEFNARLRAVDPLDEIAYLDLECEHLDAKSIGAYIRPCVMQALHDRPPFSLYCFYRCYRAMLRARLSIAHLLAQSPRTPEKWRPRALAYLRIAASDARQLQKALRRPEDRKAVSPRADGVWLQPEAAHMSGLPPYHASSPASRGTAERCRW